MARTTSTVLWSIAGCALLCLVVLGAVYGPGLWREGRALIGPIRELSRSQEALDELNARLAFEEPQDGLVSEERLLVLLEVRAELEQRYQHWSEMVETVEGQGEESLEAAKVALAETRDLLQAQIEILERHQMSGTELIWLESVVYDTWLDEIERIVDEERQPVVLQKLRETAEEDLSWLVQTEARYGRSQLSTAMKERLHSRLADLADPPPPAIDGVPQENQRLLWEHRERIMELDLEEYRGLHRDRFRQSGSVKISVDDEAD